ncbi:HIRAN domain-containing protein [Maribacter sp. MMG018]|uniref:HIRAN domain-containing protein n=1 Tax=Maribacter sp. MMG018 TaxID=2822688 RepID=UPI001B403A81|nr:HIRAN domain-containing protein [Maribacter sp. MMG018]MBQ4915280.1 HIRAN domain-containing protein [Maribacter sp. MMG018]
MLSFKRFLKKIKGTKDYNVDESRHQDYISLWTAGLNYDSRHEAVRKCTLNEKVYLEREPQNIKDNNAIHVKRKNGDSLGYVGRMHAQQLAPLLDQNAIFSWARIVALKCDLVENIHGVKIAIAVSPEIITSNTPKQKDIHFRFDKSEHNNLYLLLDCDERTLGEIIKLLNQSLFEIIRSGVSYRPGSDGNLYSWYLRLENSVDQESIHKLLRDNFPILNERYNHELEEEYFELQSEEIEDLKSRNKVLTEELSHAKKNLIKFQSIHSHRSNQFKDLINLTLPKVQFMGDSIDVLNNEIQDYSGPLKKIKEILNNNNYKAKKIKTLNGWFELHFNTGQRDDGRLYYRRCAHQLDVLVSFKKTQSKDIQFLKKQ